MRDLNDLKKAFGEADAGFVSNVYRTLENIRANESRKPVRKAGFSLAVVVTVICILSAGTVLALTNSWGILDFINGRTQSQVLPDAAGMVQKDVVQSGWQTGFGTFKVREAIYDGKNVYLVVDVKPSDPKYLLLGTDASPNDPIAAMGPFFSEIPGTIADYARDNNLEMINTSVGISGVNSVDYLLNEDGTLVYMINGSYTSGLAQADIEVNCAVAPFVSRDGRMVIDSENIQRSTFSVTLTNSGVKGTVTSTGPVEYSDFGVRVDKVTLIGSSLAIYANVEYSVIDHEKFAQVKDGLWFDFVDHEGNVVPLGVASWGGVDVLDEDHYIKRTSLQASEEMPAEITLRCTDVSQKDRGETHTFEMK